MVLPGVFRGIESRAGFSVGKGLQPLAFVTLFIQFVSLGLAEAVKINDFAVKCLAQFG